MTFWLALGVMLIGLVGALLPGIPGATLIWLAALGYGLADGFHHLTPLAFAALTILALAGATTNIWVSHSLGRLGGASWAALLAGAVLGLVGLFVGLLFAGIGAIPGTLIGTLAGILLVEWRRRRQWLAAIRAGAGWLIGYLVSSLVEFGVGLVMILLFTWQVARGG